LESAVPCVSVAPKIDIQNVSVSFTTKQGALAVLQGVDLTIRAGEFVCLVGPSGCGKSTLLSVIAGLQRADSGSVLKDGKTIEGPGPDRAVIFQESALFPWLSAVQNVEFALKSIKDKRERRAKAMEHLGAVHLARFADSHPHELSGGMRQRVAIARALALNPDILLMDEPFAALDAQTRDILLLEVQRIWQQTGKTIVFVTHNVLEAVALGDRVLCMGIRPGRIKQEIHVDLARPRQVEDPETARLAKRIMTHLRDEIDKIIREESDYAEREFTLTGPGDSDSIRDSIANTMGDGI
jgi:NitT/TauT family transport system ATP-binding protein